MTDPERHLSRSVLWDVAEAVSYRAPDIAAGFTTGATLYLVARIAARGWYDGKREALGF